MDDFYTSMQEMGIFESQEDRKSQEESRSTAGSTHAQAEALMPINFYRWPSFVTGSAAASEMPDLSGKLGAPLQIFNRNT